MPEQCLQKLRSTYDSLHSLRHDLKNHLRIAVELARVGRISESADYLQKIDARIFSVFSTGCISLDSALTVKELQMRQSGIRFERQLCALEETPIEDTELSTIVMNLLDNAIEAILRHASPPESPPIAFRIQRTREMLLIECRNPVDAATIRRRGERFLTSKSGRGHGVFHSKGDRPRGGTGGLRIRLCHHDLHDRKRPGVPAAGAPARPVPRRRGPDRHLTPVSPPAGGITPRPC